MLLTINGQLQESTLSKIPSKKLSYIQSKQREATKN